MKLSTKFWGSGLAVFAAVVALFGLTMTFAAGNPNPGVFPIQSKPYGQTYGQWSAKWWQYAFSLPVQPLPPGQEDVFANCPNEPSGQVFFLAGTAGGSAIRSCTVPAGKAILFPVFNSEQSNVEAEAALAQTGGKSSCTTVINNQTVVIPDIHGNPITGTNFAALQSCAQALADHAKKPGASLETEVDGKSLTNLTNYEALSPQFTFTTVANNPFGLCPALGSCPLTSFSASDGFWIILTPLSPGKHTIHLLATVPFTEVPPPNTFTTEATYTLTVK